MKILSRNIKAIKTTQMKNLSTLKSFMTTNFFPKQHISAYFKAHYFNELSILATFWWFYTYGLNFTVLLNTFQSFTHSLKLLHVYRVNNNRILGLDGILACLALVTMGMAGTCYPSDNGGGWDLSSCSKFAILQCVVCSRLSSWCLPSYTITFNW